MTEYISLIIAAAGLIASVYFSQRNINKSMKEIDARRESELMRRQEAAISKATQEAERHSQIVNMLNNLTDDTKENKQEICDLKEAVKRLSETQIASSRDLKTAFSRLEKVETRLELLHKEHRERMAKEASLEV